VRFAIVLHPKLPLGLNIIELERPLLAEYALLPLLMLEDQGFDIFGYQVSFLQLLRED